MIGLKVTLKIVSNMFKKIITLHQILATLLMEYPKGVY